MFLQQTPEEKEVLKQLPEYVIMPATNTKTLFEIEVEKLTAKFTKMENFILSQLNEDQKKKYEETV